MEVPEYNSLNASNGREVSIKKHYPEFYEYLMKEFPEDLMFSERIFWYYHNLKEKPVCKRCGGDVKFINFRVGYREFCSYDCMNMYDETKEKRKRTMKERWGVENPMQLQEIREKMKENNIKKYGIENVYQRDDVKEKIKKRNRERLGVDYPMQSQSSKSKMLQTRRLNRMKKVDGLISILPDGNYLMKCPHDDCNKCKDRCFTIKPSMFYDRLLWKTELCTHLLPQQPVHSKDTTLEIFVQNILDRHNIKYEKNIRNVLSDGKEVDIWIEEKKIAIECNGVYWHSKYPVRYHYDKWKDCEMNGIQLITIWEDQIIRKPEITESLIMSKLGIYKRRIGARSCDIRLIDPHTCNTFLNNTHIQGSSSSSVRIGLFYNDELVSVMTFGKKRSCMGNIQNDDEWELVRYSSDRNTQIIGGANKLFTFFIKQYNPHKIISYSSNDISIGGLYDRLGFSMEKEYWGGYWYVDKNTRQRYHRLNFTKSRLKAMGFQTEQRTEEDIVCNDLGMIKIVDSGQRRWIWKS